MTTTATKTPRSWRPEVIADETGKWAANALRFATEAEAKLSAGDLAMRWMLVRKWRAAPSDEPVNYRIVNNVMERVEEEPEKEPEEDRYDEEENQHERSEK